MGVTDGKIGLGQTVTFEGKHFGMRQRLTVKVTEFERPRLFVDEMIEGRFKTFKHIHEFTVEREWDADARHLGMDIAVWNSGQGRR